MTSFTLLVCFPATARCVCRLRVHKVSKQVNLVSKHQRMNAISAWLYCSCISISWNFLPKTSRKFFAELFRKSTFIFPEISGKIPQEISGNFRTHNPICECRLASFRDSFGNRCKQICPVERNVVVARVPEMRNTIVSKDVAVLWVKYKN